MANLHLSRRDRSNPSPSSLWRAWDNFATDFDSFFDDIDRSLGAESRLLTRPNGDRNLISPAVEVHESDNNYEISFDMPGFRQEELNLDLNGRLLSVTGHRERGSNGDKLHHSEKFYGEYRRSLTLPENVKADQIEASYENGVLTVHIPKAQTAQSRRIEIGARQRPSGRTSNEGPDRAGTSKKQNGSAQEQALSH